MKEENKYGQHGFLELGEGQLFGRGERGDDWVSASLWAWQAMISCSMATTPATAAIGQMIVVKSVDENGKPTEWEAVEKPVYIAKVTVAWGGFYSFTDGDYDTLFSAYSDGATIGLNLNGTLYYLVKVDGENNLHFGLIPYSNAESAEVGITNFYLRVSPDNSITQTRRDIATEAFVNQAIAESTPKKLSDMENDLFYIKESGRWNIALSDMTNIKTDSEPIYNFSVQKLNNPCIFNASVSINGEVSEMRVIKAEDNELQASAEFDFGVIRLRAVNGFELSIAEGGMIPSNNLNVYCFIDGEVPIDAVTFEVTVTEKKLIPSEMVEAKSKIYTGTSKKEAHEAEYVYIPTKTKTLSKFDIFLNQDNRLRVNIYDPLLPMATLLGRVEAEPAPPYAAADYVLTIDRFVPYYGWAPGIDCTTIRIKLNGVEYSTQVNGIDHTLQTGTLYTKDGELYGIVL